MIPRRSWLAGLVCLWLAGCGGGHEAARFTPPDYSYLTKLRLNVGDIEVAAPQPTNVSPSELGAGSPLPPEQALRRMAADRLVAAGSSGRGVFTIDQASITGGDGGELDGRMAVHLDIVTASGAHAGYAEAHVTRKFIPGSPGSDAGTRAKLYELTNQMMADMNVEFEYQVRRSLADWLVDASGTPLSGVEQQSLAPPGAPIPSASAPGASVPNASVPGAPVSGSNVPAAPLPVVPESAITPPQPASPTGTDAVTGAPAGDAPGAVRSPPPGFLHLPPSSQASPGSPAPPAADGSQLTAPPGY